MVVVVCPAYNVVSESVAGRARCHQEVSFYSLDLDFIGGDVLVTSNLCDASDYDLQKFIAT